MQGSTQAANGVEAAYKNAVVRAIDAAAMKADDSRDDCPHAPIDHASQAALENSELTGSRFDVAYREVFANTRYAIKSDRDASDVLAQIKNELLRVTYQG